MELFLDLVWDALKDSLLLLPFLFLTYLLMEALEHRSSDKMERTMEKIGKAGPAVGSLLGCVPQCGFSASAANLYATGTITTGTLLAVFLATSDEALPILIASPDGWGKILPLLLFKVGLGMVFGYGVDWVLHLLRYRKAPVDLCKNCGCEEEHGIVRPALFHTLQIFVFLFLINLALGAAIEGLGEERLASFLLSGTAWQPFLAALIGLIPNCASSVLLTELYLSGALSFGAALSGLSAGAGIGLAVLVKANIRNPKENVLIILTLYLFASLTGLAVQAIGI